MMGGSSSGRSSSHHHHHQRLSLHRKSSSATAAHLRYSTDDLRRQHEEEHGQVGLNVQLTVEDLERLNLMLQPPQGGGIDDAPLRVGEFLWSTIYMTSVEHRPPMATILLADVEREVRRQLELDLLMAGFDKDEKDDGMISAPGGGGGGTSAAVSSPSTSTRKAAPKQDGDDMSATMSKLSISDKKSSSNADDGSVEHGSASERAKQPNNQYLKELSYTHLRGTTILLKPNPIDIMSSGASDGGGTASGGGNNNTANNIICSLTSSPQRLHDLAISECSDAHFYLLQPFEHATIAACTGCTIVVGAVAGLLHVVDCERTVITAAARRILVSNSSDVTLNIFSPSPPLMVGDNRTCQFAPYNSYYDGFREDLLATGLAAAVVSESSHNSPYHAGGGAGTAGLKNPPGEAATAAGQQQQSENKTSSTTNLMLDASWPPLQCASNKWKQPVEMAKLEMPQVHNAAVLATATSGAPGSPTATNTSSATAAADDKAPPGTDSAIQGPVIVPASEFHVLFIPLESDAARQRRLDAAAADDSSAQNVIAAAASTDNNNNNNISEPPPPPPPASPSNSGGMAESQYCRLLAEVLHLSPFRLPAEYERRVLVKCERMKNIQQAVQKHLTLEQQGQFEEELNRGFRDWLVTSGNLRQVLDLVHLERRGQVG
jgi:Tubulin binding cofactor C